MKVLCRALQKIVGVAVGSSEGVRKGQKHLLDCSGHQYLFVRSTLQICGLKSSLSLAASQCVVTTVASNTICTVWFSSHIKRSSEFWYQHHKMQGIDCRTSGIHWISIGDDTKKLPHIARANLPNCRCNHEILLMLFHKTNSIPQSAPILMCSKYTAVWPWLRQLSLSGIVVWLLHKYVIYTLQNALGHSVQTKIFGLHACLIQQSRVT